MMSLTGCMQAGVRFLSTFRFVCHAQAVWSCFSLTPSSMWEREAGSPTSWLSYFMWSPLEPSLHLTAITDHSGTNLNQETWTGLGVSWTVHLDRAPFAQNWPQRPQSDFVFQSLNKSKNSQMLQGIHLFSCILANKNIWETKPLFLIKIKLLEVSEPWLWPGLLA